MRSLDNKKTQGGLDISAKSFITAILILAVLMVLTFALTFLLPSGEYDRVIVDGQETVVPGTYQPMEGGISIWKWVLSPFLSLTASGGSTVIAVILFLLVIGGTFYCLDKSGLMNYMLQRIVARYSSKKYTLLALVTLFFMSLGAFVGSYEECVPLVPIAVALAQSMGWDALTGLGMSILAAGCGFSSGVCNPFTVGVAQELVGLPMFSGISFRLLTFAVIYLSLTLFLRHHAKKVEFAVDFTAHATHQQDIKMQRGLKAFAIILGVGILAIVFSSFISFLQGILMPLIAVVFLLSGLLSSKLCGMNAGEMTRNFFKGIVSIAPAILLILMASSIRYTLSEAKVLDTILFNATLMIESLPQWAGILFIYLLVLVMNFFIASGSAKAFLLMPLLAPLGDLCGITRQLTVLAFAFGDGFSNVFYATNPVLLISLGLVGVGYGKWAKWSGVYQLILLALTTGILLLGQWIGY